MGDRGECFARRSRKSAPVKNAVFVGAMHKDRSRIYTSNHEDDGSVVDHLTARKVRPGSKDRRGRSDRSDSSKTPVRMSTPVRNCTTSPRYKTRNRERSMNDSDSDRSRSVISSVGSRRRFHPKYDPLIEIRRAQERLQRYRTKNDWKIDMLLCDDADEDLQRYEEKLKRRFSDRGELMGPIELERRQMELLRRQKDIDLGKVTERYAEYVLSVPKPERERYHPRTPNKFRKVSRRAWDGMIRKWRKHLHNFDDLNFEVSWRSLSTADLSGVSDVSSPQSCWSIKSDENVNPLQEGHLVVEANSGLRSQAVRSKSPISKTPNKQKHTFRQLDDDEDTLESQPKQWKGLANPCPPIDEEEDTLSSVPTRRVTRHSSGNKATHAPAADVLHSGLTNDMHLLAPTSGHKRAFSHLDCKQSIEIDSLTDFPLLQTTVSSVLPSPSKRPKRGILTQNGINGRAN